MSIFFRLYEASGPLAIGPPALIRGSLDMLRCLAFSTWVINDSADISEIPPPGFSMFEDILPTTIPPNLVLERNGRPHMGLRCYVELDLS